jgi:hypothetical protein
MRKKQPRGSVITHQELKSVLDYCPNTGFFTWKKRNSRRVQIGDRAGAYSNPSPRYLKTSYLQIMINGRNYTAHRLAWFYVQERWPTHMIDHINGDGWDNRIANLREATGSQNQMNRRALNGNNKSGVRGISITKQGTYHAAIKYKWKTVFSKTFPSMKQAKEALAIARKQIFDQTFIPIFLIVALIVSPAIAKPSVCLTYKQARELWPRVHLFWFSENHCWSNRRGPPRHIKVEPEPKPKKMKGDPVFNQIRAEDEKQIELDAVTWHMRRPFDQAHPIYPPLLYNPNDIPEPECCWPDLSEFERRFVGLQP